MQYVRNNLGIRERAELEAAGMEASKASADAEKLFAYIDYVAMMSNIELPETEEEDDFNAEE